MAKRKPRVEDIQTTVQVSVEVTTCEDYTITVDKSNPNWREHAVCEAEQKAVLAHSDVVTVRGEITDE